MIVIHVEGLVVSVAYTDVHAERLAFFQDMLKSQQVIWEKERADVLGGGSAFYLATGRLEAADDQALRAYLTFLGSRLVFLIDWNRARKQLRGFLRGPDRLDLLRWAAEAEIGHRGFLELGGGRLVNQAIEAAAGSAMHFGDRLCDVLGDAPTLDFLRFAFRTATEGLLSGSPARLSTTASRSRSPRISALSRRASCCASAPITPAIVLRTRKPRARYDAR